MRVSWPTYKTYRCFYSPTIQRADIISSHLVRNANGQIISGILALVADNAGEFCDLELTLTDKNRRSPIPVPESAVRGERLVDTYIDESEEVFWFLDEALGTLGIILTFDSPGQWLEVCRDCFYLFVCPSGKLGALVFCNVEIDPDGELQACWLEELEAELNRSGTQEA